MLGNHDWWHDGPRVARALRAAGIVVLDDEAVRLRHGGHPLWLVGLADFNTRTPDPARATSAVPPAEPVVALTHNPDIFPLVPPRVLVTSGIATSIIPLRFLVPPEIVMLRLKPA